MTIWLWLLAVAYAASVVIHWGVFVAIYAGKRPKLGMWLLMGVLASIWPLILLYAIGVNSAKKVEQSAKKAERNTGRATDG